MIREDINDQCERLTEMATAFWPIPAATVSGTTIYDFPSNDEPADRRRTKLDLVS